MGQRRVGISEFRAHMSTYLREVEAGYIIQLMHRDVEIARIVPPDYAQRAAQQELEALRETAVLGDILSPIDEEWSANDDSG